LTNAGVTCSLYYIMTYWLQPSCLRHGAAILALLSASAHAVHAQAPARRTLFTPTPRDAMREMATDRPDQTESPYTVDAGHVQLEMDLVNLGFDRDASRTRLTAWSVAPFNLKVGVLDHVDLQMVLSPYDGVRRTRAGTTATASGFGNLTTRLKVNVWGDDGGRTAFGVMGFVTWPLPASALRTGRSDWGVMLPFAVRLAEGWNLGAMSAVNLPGAPEGGRSTEVTHSVTVGHDFTRALGMYVEVLAGRTSLGPRWFSQFDLGWTYAVRDNLQVDLGSNIRLTGPVPAVQPFAGVSVRF
jgi:hypothetical protein